MDSIDITFRSEVVEDFRCIEELTREAFWNLYAPGANEHFLVHKLRDTDCYIKDLSLVAIVDCKIVGHIMYSIAHVLGKEGYEHEMLTFGPVSVSPAYHGKGIGSKLIRYSLQRATELNYKGVIILGYPCLYQRFGFKNGYDFNISYGDGKFLKSLMVLELTKGGMDGVEGVFAESEAFNIDDSSEEFIAYENTFPQMEKYTTVSQGVFQEMLGVLYNEPDPHELSRRCVCRERIDSDQ